MTLALISVCLFAYRFILMFVAAHKLDKKWLKISPHVVDTLLLTIGVVMAVKLQLNPAEHLWLAEKLMGMVAYIFTAYYTLKLARNNVMRVFGFFGALGWLMLVVRLAMTKEALFLV